MRVNLSHHSSPASHVMSPFRLSLSATRKHASPNSAFPSLQLLQPVGQLPFDTCGRFRESTIAGSKILNCSPPSPVAAQPPYTLQKESSCGNKSFEQLLSQARIPPGGNISIHIIRDSGATARVLSKSKGTLITPMSDCFHSPLLEENRRQ